MGSRWDFLYDLKPVPLAEHVVEEASKLVARELSAWPLSITDWANPQDEARFRPLCEPGAARPDDRVYQAAFRLARLELMREFEQVDDFMRNERWREFTGPGLGVDQMLLVSRYLTEQMLSLSEATEGRVKRPQLVEVLLRTERRLRAPSLVTPA